MEKIIIMIILVNIEITIIQMIIFEFENMMYLFSIIIQHLSQKKQPKNTQNVQI